MLKDWTMSAPAPWDWPPEDRGPTRAPPDDPIVDLHVRVTREPGRNERPRQRSRYDRFVNVYARVLWAVLRMLLGVALGLALGLAIAVAVWFIIAIAKG